MTFGDFPPTLVAASLRTLSLGPLERLQSIAADLGASPIEAWEFLVECDGTKGARAAVGA